MRAVVTALMALLVVVACDSTAPSFEMPTEGVHLGVIQLEGAHALSVPDSGSAGAVVRIEVESLSSAGRQDRDSTAVTLEGRVLTIEPFDRYYPGGPSPSATQFLDHTVEFTFVEPGDYTVVVRGRSQPGWRPVVLSFPLRISN